MATCIFDTGFLRIESAKNGFIVSNGQDYFVFGSLKAALKFIEESFKND